MPTENRSSNTEQMVSVPREPAQKMQWPEIVALVNSVLGCEAHTFPCERGSIGHEMTGINFNSLARIIDRVRADQADYSPGDMADQGAKAFRDGQQSGEALTFTLMHSLSRELRTVTLTKADVADGMEDTLYEKLSEQICGCEPVGETNVVDCSCDEYVHDFDLISDGASAARKVKP